MEMYMASPLRVIVLKDENVFVAQCLEIDVSAQGASEKEALSRLEAVLHAEVDAAKEAGTNLSDLRPAPKAFHILYKSNVVGRTELKLVA
jgi:predicted RNase H-like HicB family nuclease